MYYNGYCTFDTFRTLSAKLQKDSFSIKLWFSHRCSTCCPWFWNIRYCWHWSSRRFFRVQKCRTRFSLCSSSLRIPAGTHTHTWITDPPRSASGLWTGSSELFSSVQKINKQFLTFNLLLRHPGVTRDLGDPWHAVARDVCHGDAVAVDVLEEDLGVPPGQRAGLLPWKQNR